MSLDVFNEKQIEIVNNTLELAEDIVSGFYKMSPTQWLRNRYEVKTLVDLKENEKIDGPFAQIIKYSGYLKNSSLGSEYFDLYRICIQDTAILRLIEERPDIALSPLLIYIQVHELVHIVRFGKFEQFFHANTNDRIIEETRVHRVTQEILQKNYIDGLESVFAYYSTAVL